MTFATPAQACENAAKLMRAGANMVKIEGGAWVAETISTLTERAVPVCAHLEHTWLDCPLPAGPHLSG
jgi:3-methyl-2-oxobutanoate hydroxymethyltransferase